ncbi:SusC/RagA family TonB-linked outer membrane protein [uncultured Paludibacter sp.]|nr:SusC/RagA family TonB-linked outer membrane protein [uncultured Paludibacter sp.]
MRKLYVLFLSTFLSTALLFSQKTIIGVVTSSEDNSPLIGVSVTVKGTTRGVLTNIDGNYSISASSNEKLVFSYIGMQPQEISIGNQSVINVVLTPDSKVLEEVVVTAMGIKTEKKKLNFAVQSVNSDALTEGQQANFINGLQGKVSGINVTQSGGSPNSGSLLIIRGISSINPSQSNAPLYILDGVAFSGAVSDINPNDIESVTVLKGAAAAALYGQSGANGAVMITTKQAQSGKTSVSANVSFQRNDAVRTPKLQTKYGPGALGFYRPSESGGYGGWGPPLSVGEQTYDNVKNYFRPGYYQKYDVSVSGGTEKVKGYSSVFYSKDNGIIVNDYLNKVGVLLKGSYDVSKKVTLSALANITNDTYRGGSGVSSVYSWPINDDIRNYMEDGLIRYRYLSENEKAASPISPLWSRYMDYGKNEEVHNIIQGSINYRAFKNFEAIGRVIYDVNTYNYDGYTTPRFDDSVILSNPPDPTDTLKYKGIGDNPDIQARFDADTKEYYEMYYKSRYLNQKDYEKIDKNLLGTYSSSNSKSQLLTALAVLTYKVPLQNDINIDLLAGGEVKMRKTISSSITGRDFIIPGVYSISNVSEIQGVKDIDVNHSERRNGGLFGEIRGDYKGLASLSITSRWDWSSTLTQEFNPYFYPSITGGLIFSELFKLSNKWFSYGKLRGNWARVGKDTPSPYLFDRRFVQLPTLPDGGYGIDPTKSTAGILRPEMTDSWEIGLETRYFESKTRLDVAYYSTFTDNQIVTVRVSPASGTILQTRNEGSVKNYGVEIQLEQDIIKTRDFQWISMLNFGFNRGKVVSLPEDIVEIQGTQYSDVFPTAYLHGSTTAISGKDYLRTKDGKVIVNSEGYPKINPTKSVLIGDREPDFSMGLHNSLHYKKLSLAFLFDGRKGGDIYNNTARGLWGNGMHKALEFYRGRQVVWDGVVEQSDGTYKQNTTPIVLDSKTITEYYAGVSSNFIEDGSYIRLNYVTLGYDFTSLVRGKIISGLKLSLTGSNLLLLTKYTGSDPQINANTSSGGTGGMGIDNYPVPNTRGFNLTINASF